MKKIVLALLVTLCATASATAGAGQLASVSVVNESSGEHLKIWRHNGKNYVAGEPGTRYAVEVDNHTNARLLSVVSVDGVNVVNGNTAAINQAGYVIDAQEQVQIKGWRKNMDEVASFYFTQLPDSYAARTGRAENVGVIGAALFQEYVEPPVMMDQPTESANSPAPTAMASARAVPSEKSRDAKLGTGHGERQISAASTTEFRRASSQPNEVISIYYDTYAHLVARGIIPRHRHTESEPQAFPGNFVPDPY